MCFVWLQNANLFLAVDYLEVKYAMELSTPQRNYYLSAPEPTVLCQWIRVLGMCIRVCGALYCIVLCCVCADSNDCFVLFLFVCLFGVLCCAARHGVALRQPSFPFPPLTSNSTFIALTLRNALAAAAQQSAVEAAARKQAALNPASYVSPLQAAADALYAAQHRAAAHSPLATVLGWVGGSEAAHASAPAFDNTTQNPHASAGAAAAAAKFRKQLSLDPSSPQSKQQQAEADSKAAAAVNGAVVPPNATLSTLLPAAPSDTSNAAAQAIAAADYSCLQAAASSSSASSASPSTSGASPNSAEVPPVPPFAVFTYVYALPFHYGMCVRSASLLSLPCICSFDACV